MSLFVQKFGGTSVGSKEAIIRSASIITKWSKKYKVVAVLSAMSGETDRLIGLTKLFSKNPNPYDYDNAISSGENVSCSLMSIYLNSTKIRSKSLMSWQIPILTSEEHMKSRILKIDRNKILKEFSKNDVLLIPGFQGINSKNEITTLGRGGSDTSAVAVAASLDAECIIYTDVDGVYTTDPRISPGAKKIDQITTEEMLELSSQGSKVLQPRAVEFAGKYDIGIRVLSTFEEGTGTLIKKENDDNMEKAIISGIAFNQDEAQLNIRGVPDQPGIASLILGPIADLNIDVDMIVQNVGEDGLANFTFTVPRNDYKVAMQSLERSAKKLKAKKVKGNNEIVKISMVGVGMRTHAGIASKMFSVLAKNNINISMISTSEIKISVVTNEDNLETAVNVLHKEFNLDK